MDTMTAVPTNPLDERLIELIAHGPAPVLHTWHYYEPAEKSGVHKDDPAFIVIRYEVTEDLRLALIREIACELVFPIFVPAALEALSVEQFLDWFRKNQSDDYKRAEHIVDSGLRPWIEMAERENARSLSSAKVAYLQAMLM